MSTDDKSEPSRPPYLKPPHMLPLGKSMSAFGPFNVVVEYRVERYGQTVGHYANYAEAEKEARAAYAKWWDGYVDGCRRTEGNETYNEWKEKHSLVKPVESDAKGLIYVSHGFLPED